MAAMGLDHVTDDGDQGIIAVVGAQTAAFARVFQIKKTVLEVFPDKGKVEEGAQGDVQPRAAHDYKCAARRADG